jgi:two-component system cell cycle sensor histidine kinase/response regulator CckA
VAHVVNNPMAYMLMNLEHIARQLNAPGGPPAGSLDELRVAMDRARHGADRVRMIVRDLRTFSRGDDARVELVDVQAVVSSAITVAQNEIRHRARLVTVFHEIAPVDANEARLGQVFLNLLVNAAQAIVAGDPEGNEIAILTRTLGDSDVCVEVRDTGRGIPPEVLPHVFEPFFTTKPASVGTGLGLSICRNIVAGFGGRIEVESVVGRGTTFQVVLPSSRHFRALPVKVASPPSTVATSRARILVIDDEPLITEAFRRALVAHDISTTSSGREALAACRQERFDVVFCDLVMPDVGGVEVYRKLAELDPGAERRVVFMTGGVFAPGALDFLNNTENRLLEKPFDMNQLEGIVTEVMRMPA